MDNPLNNLAPNGRPQLLYAGAVGLFTGILTGLYGRHPDRSIPGIPGSTVMLPQPQRYVPISPQSNVWDASDSTATVQPSLVPTSQGSTPFAIFDVLLHWLLQSLLTWMISRAFRGFMFMVHAVDAFKEDLKASNRGDSTDEASSETVDRDSEPSEETHPDTTTLAGMKRYVKKSVAKKTEADFAGMKEYIDSSIASIKCDPKVPPAQPRVLIQRSQRTPRVDFRDDAFQRIIAESKQATRQCQAEISNITRLHEAGVAGLANLKQVRDQALAEVELLISSYKNTPKDQELKEAHDLAMADIAALQTQQAKTKADHLTLNAELHALKSLFKKDLADTSKAQHNIMAKWRQILEDDTGKWQRAHQHDLDKWKHAQRDDMAKWKRDQQVDMAKWKHALEDETHKWQKIQQDDIAKFKQAQQIEVEKLKQAQQTDIAKLVSSVRKLEKVQEQANIDVGIKAFQQQNALDDLKKSGKARDAKLAGVQKMAVDADTSLKMESQQLKRVSELCEKLQRDGAALQSNFDLFTTSVELEAGQTKTKLEEVFASLDKCEESREDDKKGILRHSERCEELKGELEILQGKFDSSTTQHESVQNEKLDKIATALENVKELREIAQKQTKRLSTRCEELQGEVEGLRAELDSAVSRSDFEGVRREDQRKIDTVEQQLKDALAKNRSLESRDTTSCSCGPLPTVNEEAINTMQDKLEAALTRIQELEDRDIKSCECGKRSPAEIGTDDAAAKSIAAKSPTQPEPETSNAKSTESAASRRQNNNDWDDDDIYGESRSEHAEDLPVTPIIVTTLSAESTAPETVEPLPGLNTLTAAHRIVTPAELIQYLSISQPAGEPATSEPASPAAIDDDIEPAATKHTALITIPTSPTADIVQPVLSATATVSSENTESARQNTPAPQLPALSSSHQAPASTLEQVPLSTPVRRTPDITQRGEGTPESYASTSSQTPRTGRKKRIDADKAFLKRPKAAINPPRTSRRPSAALATPGTPSSVSSSLIERASSSTPAPAITPAPATTPAPAVPSSPADTSALADTPTHKNSSIPRPSAPVSIPAAAGPASAAVGGLGPSRSASVVAPTAGSFNLPTASSAETSAKKPTEKLAAEPTEESAERNAEKPTEQPPADSGRDDLMSTFAGPSNLLGLNETATHPPCDPSIIFPSMRNPNNAADARPTLRTPVPQAAGVTPERLTKSATAPTNTPALGISRWVSATPSAPNPSSLAPTSILERPVEQPPAAPQADPDDVAKAKPSASEADLQPGPEKQSAPAPADEDSSSSSDEPTPQGGKFKQRGKRAGRVVKEKQAAYARRQGRDGGRRDGNDPGAGASTAT